MLVILDCDIASIFAKIDRIALLKKAFPKSDICITNSVYTELLRAKRIGFSFPDRIFDKVGLFDTKLGIRELTNINYQNG